MLRRTLIGKKLRWYEVLATSSGEERQLGLVFAERKADAEDQAVSAFGDRVEPGEKMKLVRMQPPV